jgi:glycerol transport system ATP-binding protein
MYDGGIVQIGTPAELFERPSHTFVGYFIGSPGMNIMSVAIDGATARIGDQSIALSAAPVLKGQGRIELGIRPEFIKLGREGMPITINKVEDIGRQKIVRASFCGQPISIVVPEDDDIPADAKVTFEKQAIGIFADSWRAMNETGRQEG